MKPWQFGSRNPSKLKQAQAALQAAGLEVFSVCFVWGGNDGLMAFLMGLMMG